MPIAVTAVVPNVLVVHAKVTFSTTKELIEFAQANPNKLTYCSAGSGTAPHIIAELFKVSTGVKILHVPHSGTAAAYLTFLGGNCDMMFDGLGTAAPHLTGNRIRALALTAKERSAQFPAIPTMQQSGGPEMDAGTWYGMWAPVGTPQQGNRRCTELAFGEGGVEDAGRPCAVDAAGGTRAFRARGDRQVGRGHQESRDRRGMSGR